ncbi:MAG: hypothetical protein SF053_10275 [Bacteroidia bacterium]|jgi:hypothetical protein|nr:hypothetical protein [Bacteroidia bacterium]
MPDISYFASLDEQEINSLLEAPALIVALIAGADGRFDAKETNVAAKIVNYRSFTSDFKLHDYYEAVQSGFEKQLMDLVSTWTSEDLIRVSNVLEGLNPILAKLDAEFAAELTESWRSLARRVAEAEGGLMGFGTVNALERALIELPMIH